MSGCQPCTAKCVVACQHTVCVKSCNEQCSPCTKVCGWRCDHLDVSCTLPCDVPCELLPCDRACTKSLTCSHPCPSICGEICPDPKLACRLCRQKTSSDDDIVSDLADLLSQTSLGDDPAPIKSIFLGCGHAVAVSTLDRMMNMNDFYEINASGRYVGIKPLPLKSMSRPLCPECRTPVSRIQRYGRPLKHIALLHNEKAFCVEAEKKCKAFADSLSHFVKKVGSEDSAGKLQQRCASADLLLEEMLVFAREVEFDQPRALCSQSPSHSTADPTTLPKHLTDVLVHVCNVLFEVSTFRIDAHQRYALDLVSDVHKARASQCKGKQSQLARAVTGLSGSLRQHMRVFDMVFLWSRASANINQMSSIVNTSVAHLVVGVRALQYLRNLGFVSNSIREDIKIKLQELSDSLDRMMKVPTTAPFKALSALLEMYM